MKEKTLSTKRIYASDFLAIREDTVLTYQNSEATRIVVEHSGASAILPMTKDKRYILVSQYRHPIGAITLEIPAGKLNKNEDPLACALRECEEEAKVRPTHTIHIHSIHNCLGYSDEVIHLYIGYDAIVVDDPKEKDADEYFDIQAYSKEEILVMMQKGMITDAKTLITLYHAFSLDV
jgi:ADP-ribose pyrophosphatase